VKLLVTANSFTTFCCFLFTWLLCGVSAPCISDKNACNWLELPPASILLLESATKRIVLRLRSQQDKFQGRSYASALVEMLHWGKRQARAYFSMELQQLSSRLVVLPKLKTLASRKLAKRDACCIIVWRNQRSALRMCIILSKFWRILRFLWLFKISHTTHAGCKFDEHFTHTLFGGDLPR